LPALAIGEVNRARSAEAFAGGKATHVAFATIALGARAIWIGFLGGAIGDECSRELSSLGVEVVAVPTAGQTRINFELIDDEGRITEVLEPGSPPSESESSQMLRACQELFRNAQLPGPLVISGSLPAGVSSGFFVPIMNMGRSAGCEVFLDTSGEALRASLSAGPEFVKPNRKELEALLGRSIRTTAEIVQAAKELLSLGAKSAAVTLGPEGLVWFEEKSGAVWVAEPPKLQAISTVGCGDTTLAGFVVARLQGLKGEEALRLAAAAGAANCLAAIEGRIAPSDVHSLMDKIKIRRLD